MKFFTSKKNQKKKSPLREWLDSMVFAVTAATLIRFFIFEAYTIPTPSMESSLMVGDFLFVSKLHYGVRTPKTPLQIPLTHQKIWGTDIPSYLTWLDLPIFRLPGFSSVKQGDPVVFNVPNFGPDGDAPVDLRTFYVKRCVAVPGDTLEIKNQQVYTNGKLMENPEFMQHPVFLKTKESLNDSFFDEYGVRNTSNANYESSDWLPLGDPQTNELVGYRVNTSKLQLDKMLKAHPGFQVDYEAFKDPASITYADIFPHDTTDFHWNRDFYGPLVIPAEGMKIILDSKNSKTYWEVIKNYEGNEGIEYSNGKITQNGKLLKEYTFKQDYYFMMGDNRHNSEDSRFWGFVPADHIVGKPILIWMSLDGDKSLFSGGIRWSRIFKLID